MVEAVVNFDYTAQESDELTIKKGDVIREIIKIPGGWWEGTLRDKRGMFPDNFVTPIVKDKKHKSSRVLRQCRAIFSYHPAHDDELSLAVGDIIEVIGEVEQGWWKGRIGDSEGVFPSNFVAELEPGKSHSKHSSKEDLTSVHQENDFPHLPPKPSKIICQVKYPYDACNDDELTLREGDLITLINKDGQDVGWWKGELSGRIGVFPDNFVTIYTPEVNGPPLKEKKQEKISPNKLPTSEISKSTNVAAQRKSSEIKQVSNVPPIPGKKPSVPKKSPTAVSGSTGLAGLKQKLVDMVDGSRMSKQEDKEKDKVKEQDMDFDQIGRACMLLDMRASRPKAPGRRPPSTVCRDSELVNGNTDQSLPDLKSETSNDEEEVEKKPKVADWEKMKAPWVAELEQKQAKRTTAPSTTPTTTTDHSRLKLTPTNDKTSPENHDISDPKMKSPLHDAESSPVDMSKSMSTSSSSKMKTPSNDTEYVVLRKAQPTSVTPARPQSIHLTSSSLEATKIPPITSNSSHSPATKPPIADKTNIESKTTTTASPRTSLEKKSETVSMKQYMELVDRVNQMESKMQQKLQEMQSKINELQRKLQIESDMRKHCQAELEKVAQCVTQV